MTKIELRYHHTDNKGYVYYKPAGDERGSSRLTGPSLLVNRTLIAEQFRGVDPERAKLTLTVAND